MTWPTPRAGLVIRYAYLWEREAREGRDEASKDRPCAIVLALLRESGATVVRVLPVTHSPPQDPDSAIEIPSPTKARLGLDAARSWIMLDEANDFIWPGPDLRPNISGVPQSVVYGALPPKFMDALKKKLVARYNLKRAKAVKRTT